ncbi:MAG: PQQ-binding-like beta-propeller repeat protein [Halobacteriales archaeon]
MTGPTDATTRRQVLGALGAAGLAGAVGEVPDVATAAGGGDWRLFRFDERNSGANPAGRGPSGPVGTRWTASLGDVSTPPVLDADTAYVADTGAGAVRAFDRATGDERWSTSLEVVSPRMALSGDTLYVPGDGLFALDADTGERLWTAGGDTYYAVLIRDGFAQVAGVDGLAAISLRNRETLWRNEPASVIDAAHVAGEERLFAVSSRYARVRAVDPGGGNTRWKRNLEMALEGAPVVAGGRLLVPGESALTALDVTTGSTVWTDDRPVRGSVAATGGTVYGNTADGETFALDAETGTEAWRRATVSPAGGPTMVGDALFLAGDDGTVAAVDPADGTERWRSGVDGPLETPPVVAGGEMVVAGGGTVHSLAADAATPAPTAAEGTATPTATPTGTATRTATEDAGSDDDEEGGGMVMAAVAVGALLVGGAGAAVLGSDAIREALGSSDEDGDGAT